MATEVSFGTRSDSLHIKSHCIDSVSLETPVPMSKIVPTDYPPDLYWKGKPPREEYNYVLVDVAPGEKTKLSMTRYRPGSAQPFATEALFS